MNPVYEFDPIMDEKILTTLTATQVIVRDKHAHSRHMILTSQRLLVYKNFMQTSLLTSISRRIKTPKMANRFVLEYEIQLEDIMDLRPSRDPKRKRYVELIHLTGRTYFLGPSPVLYPLLQQAIAESEAMDTIQERTRSLAPNLYHVI